MAEKDRIFEPRFRIDETYDRGDFLTRAKALELLAADNPALAIKMQRWARLAEESPEFAIFGFEKDNEGVVYPVVRTISLSNPYTQ